MAYATRLFSIRRSTFAVTVLFGALALVPLAARADADTIVTRYSDALALANTRMPQASRRELAERLLLLSSYYKIDPRLLLAVVSVESNWRPGAISPVGALGYGQLMPATAANLKVQAMEPYENLDGTARYLRRMITMYAASDPMTRVRLAAASYNAGPYAVKRYGGVPPYHETQNYVRSVVSAWQRFSSFLSTPSKSDVSGLLAAVKPPVSPPQLPLVVAKAPDGSRAPLTPRPGLPIARSRAVRPTSNRTPRAFVWIALHAGDVRPKRSPMRVDEIWHPSAVAEAPVVRYETSHSLVARIFGRKHRVVEPAPTPIIEAIVSTR